MVCTILLICAVLSHFYRCDVGDMDCLRKVKTFVELQRVKAQTEAAAGQKKTRAQQLAPAVNIM